MRRTDPEGTTGPASSGPGVIQFNLGSDPATGGDVTMSPYGSSGVNYAAMVPTAWQGYLGQSVPGLGHHTRPTTVGPGNQAYNSEQSMAVRGFRNVPSHTSVTMQGALEKLLTHDSSKQILELQQHLIQAGYLNPGSTGFTAGAVSSSDDTFKAYATAIADSIEQQKNLRDIIYDRIHDPNNTTGQTFWAQYQHDQATGGSGGSATTSVSTALTNGTDARVTAQNAYESMLGRRPTNKEVQAFHGALNAYEQAHPQVTNQTTTPGGDSTSTQTGGSNPGALAEQDIIDNHGEEFAHAQSTGIYNIFSQMLGGS